MAYLESFKLGSTTYRFPLYHGSAASSSVIYNASGIPGQTSSPYFLNSSSMLKYESAVSQLCHIKIPNGTVYDLPGCEYILNSTYTTFQYTAKNNSYNSPQRVYKYYNTNYRFNVTGYVNYNFNFYSWIGQKGILKTNGYGVTSVDNMQLQYSFYGHITVTPESNVSGTWRSVDNDWFNITFNDLKLIDYLGIRIMANGSFYHSKDSQEWVNINYGIYLNTNLSTFISSAGLSYTPSASYTTNILLRQANGNFGGSTSSTSNPPSQSIYISNSSSLYYSSKTLWTYS